MAAAVRAQTAAILAANAEDVAEARAAGVAGAFLDRLSLDDERIEAIAAASKPCARSRTLSAPLPNPGPGPMA